MATNIAAINAAKIDEKWKYMVICHSYNSTLSFVFGETLSYYCVTVSDWYKEMHWDNIPVQGGNKGLCKSNKLCSLLEA